MEWWVWASLGVALLVGEILTASFFLLFFGLGALAVALLDALHVSARDWTEWVLFAVLSLGMLIALRSRLVASRGSLDGRAVDSLVGESAVLKSSLAAGTIGDAELRGTVWSARNIGVKVLSKSQRVRVVGVEGLTLLVDE